MSAGNKDIAFLGHHATFQGHMIKILLLIFVISLIVYDIICDVMKHF
jgi:hypothetical protein